MGANAGQKWPEFEPGNQISRAPVVSTAPGIVAIRLVGVVITRPGQLALKPLEIGLR